jgi:hypothetical protein
MVSEDEDYAYGWHTRAAPYRVLCVWLGTALEQPLYCLVEAVEGCLHQWR